MHSLEGANEVNLVSGSSAPASPALPMYVHMPSLLQVSRWLLTFVTAMQSSANSAFVTGAWSLAKQAFATTALSLASGAPLFSFRYCPSVDGNGSYRPLMSSVCLWQSADAFATAAQSLAVCLRYCNAVVGSSCLRYWHTVVGIRSPRY